MHCNCFEGICSGPPGPGGIFNANHSQFKNIKSAKGHSKGRFVKHYNIQASDIFHKETKSGLLKYLSNKRCLTLN